MLGAVAAGVRVVNLDALTYAGNLDTSAAVAFQPESRVRARGHRRPGRWWIACWRSIVREHRELRGGKPRRSFHRRPRGVHSDQRRRHAGAAGGRARLLDGADRTASGAAFRFLHVSTDEVYGSLGDDRLFRRDDCVRAEFSVLGLQGGVRSPGSCRFHHTYGLPVLTTNCSNNYGPYQFPEKLIPLMILKAIAGEAPPGLRRRRQRARLALRRRSLRGHRAGARGWESRPKRTISAAIRSAETSTWCARSASLVDARMPRSGRLAARIADHASSRTGPGTTVGTRSTRARSGDELGGCHRSALSRAGPHAGLVPRKSANGSGVYRPAATAASGWGRRA